jgi:hypothetical protein
LGISLSAGWCWCLKMHLDMNRNALRSMLPDLEDYYNEQPVNGKTQESNLEFEEFIKLEKLHLKEKGDHISLFLYPDNFNGRYFRALPFKYQYK